LGGLEICLVGDKSTKALCGDGTGYQNKSISKPVLPNHEKIHQNESNIFSKRFLLK